MQAIKCGLLAQLGSDERKSIRRTFPINLKLSKREGDGERDLEIYSFPPQIVNYQRFHSQIGCFEKFQKSKNSSPASRTLFGRRRQLEICIQGFFVEISDFSQNTFCFFGSSLSQKPSENFFFRFDSFKELHISILHYSKSILINLILMKK